MKLKSSSARIAPGFAIKWRKVDNLYLIGQGNCYPNFVYLKSCS